MFNKIIILGLGLIGGSIAKSCKKNNLSHQILAFNKSRETLEFALKNGIIDGIYDFNEKISNDDLVIIAAPLLKYHKLIAKIAPNLSQNTIITDVGSVKLFIETDILRNFRKLQKNFISAHPIAGSDKSGVKNSESELFKDKKLIIIQNEKNDPEKVEKIALFWQKIGSKVEYLTAEKHDKIYALVSHLPQKIAFEFFAENQSKIANPLIQKHLRLQNSNPKMWEDIFYLNKKNILNYRRIFATKLSAFKFSLKKEKYQRMSKYLEKLDLSQIIPQEIPRQNQNFILGRILIVAAFLSIEDISEFQSYIGSGFRDFTIILSYLKYLALHPTLFEKLLQENNNFISKSLHKL